jgi:hypothetical protein
VVETITLTLSDPEGHTSAAVKVPITWTTPATHTLFGACPAPPAGESKAAAQSVLTKWGTAAAVRQFFGGTAAPNVMGSIYHGSWKCGNDYAGLIAGTYDAAIMAMLKPLPAGTVVEFMHELDAKVRAGSVTLAQGIAAKNHFYDVAKAANPGVLVWNTLTSWLFDPTSGLDPSAYAAVKCDGLGDDCDGINFPAKTTYYDYTNAWAKFVTFAKAQGKPFSVPEFGAQRLTSDPDGTLHATWITRMGQMFAASGAKYVCFFDYPPEGPLTTAAEMAAVKSLMTT